MVTGPSRLVYAVLAIVAVVGLATPLGAEVSWRPHAKEFKVNNHTQVDQYRPSVATNAAGRSFVVWTDGGLLRLYGRLLDASGQPLSGDLWIDESSSQLPLIQFFPARVAAGREGQFVVTWSAYPGKLMIRRYDANGEPLSGPVVIRTEPLGEWPGERDIAFDAAGNFFLTWSTFAGAPVLVQKFDASGTPLTPAYRIDQGTEPYKRQPRIALDLKTGTGVAVWTDDFGVSDPGVSGRVSGRLFTSTGQPLGSEFPVEVSTNGEVMGAIPVFHAGGFSVVWNRLFLESGIMETMAQRFDVAGTRVGSAVILSQEGFDIFPPAVAAGPYGRVLVLWPGTDVHESAVVGRLFDSSWQPASPLFQVNSYVQWDQTEPAVATDGRGNYTAVWISGAQQFPVTPGPIEWPGQDGSSYGVFGQRFSFTELLGGRGPALPE
jgi:hypothetical protein